MQSLSKYMVKWTGYTSVGLLSEHGKRYGPTNTESWRSLSTIKMILVQDGVNDRAQYELS